MSIPVDTRFIGLVIGPRGMIIKTIQDKTNTCITTPLPCQQMGAVSEFEVQGEKSNVFRARALIYKYIFDRTHINLENVNDQICGIKVAENVLEEYKNIQHPISTHVYPPDDDAHPQPDTIPFAHVGSPDNLSEYSSALSSTNTNVVSSPAKGLGKPKWGPKSLCSVCHTRKCVNFPWKCGHATLCRQCLNTFLCANKTCPGYYGRIAAQARVN